VLSGQAATLSVRRNRVRLHPWPDPPVPHVNGVPKEYAALFREAAVTSLRSHKARSEEVEPCAASPLWLQRTRYGEELSRPYHPSVLRLL
jgi:hypothetical protein